jgi:NAD(P)-dependent dehydrogenase (short-subunit alcohol dehydrogenase family)
LSTERLLNSSGSPQRRHTSGASRVHLATPFGHTAGGFETQFGTNHLGQFVLVNRIAKLLRPGGRLIKVSSAGHRFSNVDWRIRTSNARLMSPSLHMAGQKPQTFCSPLHFESNLFGLGEQDYATVCHRTVHIHEERVDLRRALL